MKKSAVFTWVLCAAVFGCTPQKTSAQSTDGGKNAAIGDASLDAASSAIDASTDDSAGPPKAGDELTTRMRHLLEAIEQDNPDLAKDVMFPRDAWMDQRDSTDPAKAWDKAIASFEKSVHRLHKKMKGIANAKFVSFELGTEVARSTGGKKHEWKRPIWRTRHAKLTVSIDDKTKRIDINDLVAFRGSWYVTRVR